MKRGDLVKYKDFPENGHGIVILVDTDMLFLYWFSGIEAIYDDYVWEYTDQLETLTTKPKDQQ